MKDLGKRREAIEQIHFYLIRIKLPPDLIVSS